MTTEAERVTGNHQIRAIRIAVDIVTVEAAQPAMVHHTLHKVVALHPILVSRSIWPEVKILNSEQRNFKVPNIRKPLSWKESNRPINIVPTGGKIRGTALAVALNAD